MSPRGTFDICASFCYRDYRNQYDHLRGEIEACEAIRTRRTINKPKYCTRKVLVGYEVVDHPSDPYHRAPIYRTETYQCGVEQVTEVVPLAEESDAVYDRYRACKTETELQFDIEHESILYKYDKCLKDCKERGSAPGAGAPF